MASVKVKFIPSDIQGHPGSIHYLITHRNSACRIPTSYLLFSNEWNPQSSSVMASLRNPRRREINSIRRQIRCDMDRLYNIIQNLEISSARFTADDIAHEFIHYSARFSLFNFMECMIENLRENGRHRTAETYSSALNSFRRFRRGEDLRIDFLTSEIMEAFSFWHKSQGNCPNTISFYCRILRAVYNRALEEGGFEDTHPFRRVYTGIVKTKKRALPLKIIRRIKRLDLTTLPSLDYARDIFILSFMLRGMSFIDMAFLKKSDLCNGILSYRRRKTSQQLSIAWTNDMQHILDKYTPNETDFLLPIICRDDLEARTAYRNKGYAINRGLKRIAGKIGLNIPLTLYVARHSWATAAKEKGVPISVICEGMGHEREQTTRIYLNTIETTAVDKANSLIINSIK